eukprot:Nitzschia sp. Nitz4//scaffold330_size19141//12900//13490//NITZ4_008747-RA/size19141-processed-gene-0.19-mRNA-1//-1//CDS//3329548163//3810//frame0
MEVTSCTSRSDSVNLPKSISSPKRERRKNQRLQFNESVRVKFHIHRNDMSRSEIHAMWYSEGELQRKLQRRKRRRRNTPSCDVASSPSCTPATSTTVSPAVVLQDDQHHHHHQGRPVSPFCFSSLNQELFDLGPSMMSSSMGYTDAHPPSTNEDESDTTSEEGSSEGIVESPKPKGPSLLPPSPCFTSRKRQFLAV